MATITIEARAYDAKEVVFDVFTTVGVYQRADLIRAIYALPKAQPGLDGIITLIAESADGYMQEMFDCALDYPHSDLVAVADELMWQIEEYELACEEEEDF